MNADIKKVMNQVKNAQAKLQGMLKSQDWMEEARKYADKQRGEVKKLFAGDLSRVRTFLEKERKELEKFQKRLPGEVDRFKTIIQAQRKDLEKLLANVKKMTLRKAGSKGRKGGRKKASGGATG